MKAIYKLNFDCGRQGELTGVFVAEKEKVKILIDNKIEVYWGEVLGKHSEVFGPLDEGEITMVSDNQEAVELVQNLKLETGYNPFHYTSIHFSHAHIENTDDMTIGEICEILSSPL